MKIFLLLVVGLALCSAVPQENESRPRMRNPRRFSIATPGLQSVNRAEAAANVAEELVEQVVPTRGASRGTALPRRGRPTLRPRASIQVEETETKPSTSRRDNGRSGLQLRRPKSRPTTTTTLPPPPPPIDEVPEMIEEMQKEEDTVMDHKVEKTMTKENKVMEKDEEANPTAENKMTEKIKETDVIDTPTTEAPKPKLRPIPIKLGRREQGTRVQQLTAIEPQAVSPRRHRFTVASETGGSLRVRSRGKESILPSINSKNTAEETSSLVDQGAPRVRRPTPPKQTPRISSRRTSPAEEVVVLEQEVTDTENRFI